MRILNGRTGSDSGIGKFTCHTHRGKSVVDYILVSTDILPLIYHSTLVIRIYYLITVFSTVRYGQILRIQTTGCSMMRILSMYRINMYGTIIF